MKRFCFFIILIFSFTLKVNAQNVTDLKETTNLYNTQEKVIHSNIVDDDFRLFISVPDDYVKSGKKYPVLYLLDGDIAYGMAASIARYLQVGNIVPELIIVGIGYGALKRADGNMRRRDYTISVRRGIQGTGGAPKFKAFLREELIPYIDKNFRTKPGERTLEGYSLGGLFAVYTLFTEPELFNRYIIGSPYLSWDDFKIFDVQDDAFKKFKDINAKVFISVGSEEDEEKYFNPTDDLVTNIETKDYKGLKLDTKVFEGGTHLICPPETISYGLISVFGK